MMKLEYMDLSAKYETLEQTILSIDTTYTDAVTSAEEEFALVKENGITMSEQVAEASGVFAEVDISTDTEGNCVYEGGMESLGSATEEFDEALAEKKMKVKQRLGFKEGDAEPGPEPELPEDEERVYLSKDDLLEKVDKQINYMEAVKEYLPEEAGKGDEGEDQEGEDQEGEEQEGEDQEGEDQEGDEGEEEEEEYVYELSQKGAEEAIEDLNDFKSEINEYYENAIRAVNDIPVSSEITTLVQEIIQEEIETPLVEEIMQVY